MPAGTLCEECCEHPATLYCPQCNQKLCEACWIERRPHRRRNHEHLRNSLEIHERIASILEPGWSSTEQSDQHRQDNATLWFSLDISKEKQLELVRTDRFSMLVNKHHRLYEDVTSFFPRLVSFIGDTGHGKSTLVRLLIEEVWTERGPDPADARDGLVPVVGRAHDSRPTSGDVHLYRDFDLEHRNKSCPIFFADCEGFLGGGEAPSGSRMHQLRAEQDFSTTLLDVSTLTVTPDSLRRFVQQTTEKLHIRLPESMASSKRETAVTELFPRLLYNFSDVVVYTMSYNKLKSIRDVMVDLLKWAQVSSTDAVNQPTLPHVIIAINQTPNTTGVEWDPTRQTSRIMEENIGLLASDDWVRTRLKNSRGNIRDLQSLFRSSYSSIQFISIPFGARSVASNLSLLAAQVRRLHDMIDNASCALQEQKRALGMLLASRDQERFFKYAFQHYARHLDKPFDFIAQLIAMQPISGKGGNGVPGYLAACGNEVADSNISAAQFMEWTFPTLASGLALHQYRHYQHIPGLRLMHVFTGRSSSSLDLAGTTGGQKALLQDAIEKLCSFKCTCEYEDESGARCLNVKSGHTGGHRVGDSQLEGNFISGFVHDLENDWADVFEQHLHEVDDEISRQRDSSNGSNQDIAWPIHLKNLIRLYTAIPRLDMTDVSTCSWCFNEAGFHLLPCGHTICTYCAQLCGKPGPDNDLRLLSLEICYLHPSPHRFPQVQTLQMKPPMAGLRVLCLDGGGVRGINELMILEALEEKLGGGSIPIQRFFDIIGGTSAGALIAMGLGIKDWTIKECKKKYKELCKSGFVHRNHGHIRRWPLVLFEGSLYETTPLTRALECEYGAELIVGENTPKDFRRHFNKVFVTSTVSGGGYEEATIVANYIRVSEGPNKYEINTNSNHPVYDFELGKGVENRFKLWEAARATSAAPAYFKPFEKSNKIFWDGGLRHNNPSYIADLESKLLWPDQNGSQPDILLSVGSGHGDRYAPTGDLELNFKGIMKFVKSWLSDLPTYRAVRVLKKQLEYSQNSEAAWWTHFGQRVEDYPNRFVRLNLEYSGIQPALDDTSALQDGTLENVANSYIHSITTELNGIARRLVATSFYFEPHKLEEDMDRRITIRGAIRLRFLNGSDEIAAFGALLKTCQEPRFAWNTLNDWAPEIEPRTLEDMQILRTFKLDIVIQVPLQVSELTIQFLVGDKFNPEAETISGSPMTIRNGEGDLAEQFRPWQVWDW